MVLYNYEYYDEQLKKIVFRCYAKDFDDADVLFKKETGADYPRIRQLFRKVNGHIYK